MAKVITFDEGFVDTSEIKEMVINNMKIAGIGAVAGAATVYVLPKIPMLDRKDIIGTILRGIVGLAITQGAAFALKSNENISRALGQTGAAVVLANMMLELLMNHDNSPKHGLDGYGEYGDDNLVQIGENLYLDPETGIIYEKTNQYDDYDAIEVEPLDEDLADADEEEIVIDENEMEVNTEVTPVDGYDDIAIESTDENYDEIVVEPNEDYDGIVVEPVEAENKENYELI